MIWVALVGIAFGFGLAVFAGWALSHWAKKAPLSMTAATPTELEQLASIEGGHFDRRVDRDGTVFMTMHYPDGSALVGKGPTTKAAIENMRALMLHHRRA